MNPELWNRVKEALIEFEDLPSAQQSPFLVALGEADPACHKALLPLLEVEEDSLGFLAQPLFHISSEIEQTTQIPSGGMLGPYRLVKRLGSGGMGTVFLAQSEENGSESPVAIKVLKRGLETHELRTRFHKERRILGFLDHPNIAKLLDYGTTENGRPYLVMEYIEGEHITHYCDRNRLSIRERLKVFQKICGSVQYAHQNLIIHRDLKPANILVTSNGEPKLLDFGIAKLIDSRDDQTAVTQTLLNLRPMTPDYASPEQVKGAVTGTTCDIYALGVVLYELLTGRRPYSLDGLSDEDRIRMICETQPERPSQVVVQQPTKQAGGGTNDDPASISKARGSDPRRLSRTLRGDLDTIVAKALRKEPERRYASAEQFSADIERQLLGFPLQAQRENSIYTTRKFIRRHGVLVSGVLTAIFILVAFSITVWRQNARLKRQRDIAEEERQRVVYMSDTFQRIMVLAGDRQVPGGNAVIQQALAQTRERFDSRSLSDRERASKALALGMAHAAINEHKLAEVLLEQARKLHWRAFHEDGRALPQSMLTLASFYLYNSRYEEALYHLEEVLQLYERTAGPDALEIGPVYGQIATAYDGLGEFEKAKEWFLAAMVLLESRRQSHFQTWASVQNGYAAHLRKRGEIQAAATIYREVLTEKESVYGPNDLDLVFSIQPLAELYVDEYFYDKGLALMVRAREIYTASKARHQPEYFALLERMVAVNGAVATWPKVAFYSREALALLADQPGQALPWLQHLAEALCHLGRPMEAEAHLRQAMAIGKSGSRDELIAVMVQLAGALRQARDLGEARLVLKETRGLLPSVYDSGHRLDAAIFREEAALALAENWLMEAEGHIDNAIQLDRMRHGTESLPLAADYYLAAKIYRKRSHLDRAELAAEFCLDLRLNTLVSPEHRLVRAAQSLYDDIKEERMAKTRKFDRP